MTTQMFYYKGARCDDIVHPTKLMHRYVAVDGDTVLTFDAPLNKHHRVGWAYGLVEVKTGAWKADNATEAVYHPVKTNAQLSEVQRWSNDDAFAREQMRTARFLKNMKTQVNKAMAPLNRQYRSMDSAQRREMMYLVVQALTDRS